jgi:probable addiction module antidote protein
MPTIDYKDTLLRDLQDPTYAAGYLTASLEESEDVFLLAVRDVAQAHGGITALAQSTKLNRENLYDMLSTDGNPRLSSITAILSKLGFEIKFAPKGDNITAA